MDLDELSPNTVLGRTGISPGLAQAIPFATLSALLPSVGKRTSLVADTTYYVNGSTGSDSNPGIATLPFKTLNYAWAHLSSTLDPAGHIVTINLAAGSYPLQIDAQHTFISGSVSILGTGSASTKIIDFDLAGNHPVQIDFDQVTFVDDGAALHNAVFFTNGLATIGVGFSGSNDVVTDTTANAASFGINPTNNTNVFWNSLTAKGNAHQLLNPAGPNCGLSFDGTITLVGPPNYSVGVCQIVAGTATCGVASFVGSAVGPKYQIMDQGILSSSVIMPGTIEGQVFGSGEYVGPDTNVIFTPITGNTITMVNLKAIIKPAGTLATLTIHLPSTTSTALSNGENGFQTNNSTITVSTTQTLTALTVSSVDGSTVLSPPTTLAAGGSFKMLYDTPSNTWYPTT